MAKEKKDAAIRKRQLIAKANQTMFVSVALASAVVGFTSVLTTFLVREMMFNAKVISAQDKSIKTLKDNLNNVAELETKMEELQTNSALLSSRANSEDNALRVVIDALPSFENSAALGASISNKLLNVPGIKIDSMTVDTAASDATSANSTGEASAPTTGDAGMETGEGVVAGVKPQPIAFAFTVSSNDPKNILDVIKNLERSIRAINITSFKIEQGQEGMTLAVNAQAFYMAQAEVKLREEVIKSGTAAGSSTSQTSTSETATEQTTSGGQ